MEKERLQLYKSLVNEITKGMEQVKQLEMSSSDNDNEQEGVLERMLSSHEEALLILTGRAPQGGRCRKTRTDIWNMRVKTSAASVEAVPGDGYSWRKYGQKDILGSKYPRCYYRCQHRNNSQGCLATKQLQRLDDDPTAIDITYRGKHTCQAGALASNTEETQESIHARLEP